MTRTLWRRWTVVIPVKPARIAKSRLCLPGIDRATLARAVALDTISAATKLAHVVVVTADTELRPPGAKIVLEDRPIGIAAAVEAGLAAAPSTMAAVLLGDVPGLRPADLAEAFALAEEVRLGAVPDMERIGTTLVTAREGPFRPQFGFGSWEKHQAAGFMELHVAHDSSLRRDVDTAAHLSGELGVHTSAVLAERGWEAAGSHGEWVPSSS